MSFFGMQALVGTKYVASKFEPEQMVKSGLLKELKSSISRHGGIDPRNWHEAGSGKTLLHYAAASNQVEIIDFLISESKVPIDLQDMDGNTPLHLAVLAGHIEATSTMLAYRANDTVLNANKDPPLHSAIKQNSEQGNKLVAEFAKHPRVNLFINGYNSYSSLHIIATSNNQKALEIVYHAAIEVEEDPTVRKSRLLMRGKNGLTSFHVAARTGSTEVLEFLLSKYVDCDISCSELHADLSHDSRSPLIYAVERGHRECVQALLKYGADPTATSGFHPSPIHIACSHGKLSIVKAMVEARGQDILQARDREGGTTLHSSTSSICSKELISFLVENGVGINDVDSNGFSALSNAIQLGSIDAVEELLKLGANPVIKDEKGRNSLHAAVLSKRIEIFRKLISCSAADAMATSANNLGLYPVQVALKLGLSEMVISLLDVTSEEFKYSEGNNYLHLAAASGDEKTLVHLLRKPHFQYMINEANTSGSTPLHFAALGSSAAIVKKLTGYGAVIHKNHDGLTPLMCACSAGNLETVKVLYESSKFQRDWVDLCGRNSLHLAVDGGNPEVITFCLDKKMAITYDNCGLSFFDGILDRSSGKLATAALSHKRWKECIDVCSPNRPHPILRIIDQIPEVYGIILDHCFTYSNLAPTHPDYWEEFDYKCLRSKREQGNHQEVRDINSRRETIEMMEEFRAVHTQLHTENDDIDHNTEIPTQVAGRRQNLFLRLRSNRIKRKSERSLTVITKLIETDQASYLLHPVVKSFVNMKWLGLGILFQTIIMLIHFLLAVCFSVFVGSFPPPPLNSSVPLSPAPIQSGDGMESDVYSISAGFYVLLIITLVLSILNFMIFCLQAYTHGFALVTSFTTLIQVWFNLIASCCILVFLVSVLVSGLREALWNSAALGVFFAWFSYGTTLQLLNIFNIGVYITMLISTTKLILNVLVILIAFLLGFTFSFYILAGSVDRLQYSSIGLSMYTNFHSLVAVTDYLGFAAAEQDNRLRFTIWTFILLSTLVVLVPIVCINLLIGLAVGDIARIHTEATISHLRVEVRALESFDKRLFPHYFTKHISKTSHRHYPNKAKGSLKWLVEFCFERSDDAHKDAKEDRMRRLLQADSEEERKKRESRLEKLQEGINQLAADRLEQLEGMKRLEAMVVGLMQVQQKDCVQH